LTSSHLWDANAHPPLPGPRGEKTLTTGGPGKEQGTNKLTATRILQRSTRGQQEMGDCSPEEEMAISMPGIVPHQEPNLLAP